MTHRGRACITALFTVAVTAVMSCGRLPPEPTEQARVTASAQYATPGPSRQQRPGIGRYVAIGDSYTASLATGPAVGEPRACGRSANNYPRQVAAALQAAVLADVSCGSAYLRHLFWPQPVAGAWNAPQLAAVTADTALVTVSIGANDLGLVEITTGCVSTSPHGSICRQRYSRAGRDELAERLRPIGPALATALREIHRRAPHAIVLVVGYPAVLPASGPGCWPRFPYTAEDIAYLRQFLEGLNDTLAAQAATNGAGYVDVHTPGAGRDVCSADDVRWVQGLVPAANAVAVHPTPLGQQGIANAILTTLRGAAHGGSAPQGN